MNNMKTKHKKLKVIIGIPAFNEEKNVGKLLASLLNQEENSFTIQKIVVVSDMSTDLTDSIVRKFNSKLIELHRNKERTGKTGIIKFLIRQAKNSKADILILIDSDLGLEHQRTISLLINNFWKDNELAIVSGKTKPFSPSNFAQKVAYFNYLVWEKLLTKNDSLFYRSSDQLIGLKMKYIEREFFDKFQFVHDEFFFLYCKRLNKGFLFEEKSVAFYKLPTSLSDYRKQMIRFLSTGKITNQNFQKNYVRNYHTITTVNKFIVFLQISMKQPVVGAFFLIFQLGLHIESKLRPMKISSTWDIVASTK